MNPAADAKRAAGTVVPLFDDPIWEVAFEGSLPPVAFYNLAGRAGLGDRLVAWNTSDIGWIRPRSLCNR